MIRRKLIHVYVFLGLLGIAASTLPYTFSQTIVKQGKAVPPSFCITPREVYLHRMINEYRQFYNLPPIPLSKSLCYVAALHAKDLFLQHPDQGACNFHSWSNKGPWLPFCYPKDENKKNSVWDKPRELTKYPAKAYEIVYWENNPLIQDTILMVWKMEEYFNSFLLNSGKWQGKTWNAIGIAVYENYACAWFGEIIDPEGDAFICGSKPVNQEKDTIKLVKKSDVKPVKSPPVKPKKSINSKTGDNVSDSLRLKKSDTLKVKPVESPAVNVNVPTHASDSATGTYYIIINSMLTKEKANELVSTLKSKGHPNAKLIEKNGKNNVSLLDSPDKPAITVILKEVKKTYRDAWLLKMTSDK